MVDPFPSPPPPPPAAPLLRFRDAATLPQRGDNAAVAQRLLPSGTRIVLSLVDDDVADGERKNGDRDDESSADGNGGDGGGGGKTDFGNGRLVITLSSPCLEGHRFALRDVAPGDPLLSWGLPFGTALGQRDGGGGPTTTTTNSNGVGIRRGDVLLNAAAAEALRERLCGPQDRSGVQSSSIRELLGRRGAVNFVDLDVGPERPFVIEKNGGFNAVGMNVRRSIQDATATAAATGNDDDEDDEEEDDIAAAGRATMTASATTTTTNPPRGTFLGFRRSFGRGVGTRNHVIVLALTASSSPLVMPHASRWRHRYDINDKTDQPNDFDGVRVVAHTEGEGGDCDCVGGSSGGCNDRGGTPPPPPPNNAKHVHRCLAGFLTHPNVGAAVVVTTGRERHVTKKTLSEFVHRRNAEKEEHDEDCDDGRRRRRQPLYPPECFAEPFAQWVELSSGYLGGTTADLDDAVALAVRHATNGVRREPCPLSFLTIALQCGGSDAFSGLTGNPLAGDAAASLLFDFGSRAILAESPELVGAEPYVLSRVASRDVALRFIQTTERYKAFAARHGQSAAGNPSGGNLYRGLYNITLKSLGAARKKPPKVALDSVLEYGEPMVRSEPLYFFMDSPGNDLESIAGQVASGCNLIVFITGNGALTNFPFVPTVKVVTTSERFRLLENEMDVDAGPYGCGGDDRRRAVCEATDLFVRVASGERSKGELSGHSQVSLWRNWAIGDDSCSCSSSSQGIDEEAGTGPPPRGTNMPIEKGNVYSLRLCSDREPHRIRADPPPLPASLLRQPIIRRADPGGDNATSLRPWPGGATYALVPTSLCSSAIASTLAELASAELGCSARFRVVCPGHTEGCGAAGDAAYERTYERLLIGHALHPSVGRALFLEHGCEKTHNDHFRHCLRKSDVFSSSGEIPDDIGFWSLQGGGGFAKAKDAVLQNFRGRRCCSQTGKSRPVFGVPWSERPVAVGILVDAVAARDHGPILASAVATVVRFLSRTRVHSVVPSNSLLVAREWNVAFHRKEGDMSQVGERQRPTTTGDMEDFFSKRTAVENARQSEEGQPSPSAVSESISAVFACETLDDATIPCPTLLAGQMAKQTQPAKKGGLHIMDVPSGASHAETVSCLGPACDAVLLICNQKDSLTLPGSCLSPTLRRSAPVESDNLQAWQEWTTCTCKEIMDVLRSPLVCGGDGGKTSGDVTIMLQTLFSLTTFVVPRGKAVSL